MARSERFREYALTAGTLGSTAGQTVMVAVLPVLLSRHATLALWIGFAVGGEGIFALLVPYWIGWLSDHLHPTLHRRFGRRTFFLMLTAPLMAASLAIAPFLDGYWPLAGAAFVYFAALHGYLTPLWSLMVDAVPEERRGRVQGFRGALHSMGLGYGLVASGLLYAIWHPLPFLVGALLILVSTGVTIAAAPSSTRDAPLHEEHPHGEARAMWQQLRAEPAIRWFLIANALWTGAVDGIRPYIFLFATIVVGITVGETSMLLSLLVLGAGVGSVVLGRLSDRTDRARLLQIGGLLITIAMMAGFFVRNLTSAVALLLASGIGAAALIALPYPIFAGLVGNRAIGRYTGLYILTIGLGRIVAPMIVGLGIDLALPYLREERGYPIMWPLAGMMSLAGVFALHRALGFARKES